MSGLAKSDHMPERTPLGPFRPRIEPTAEDIEKIEQWAKEGCAQVEMARGLGVSKDLLSRWRTDHPAVADALEIGKATLHTALRSKLVEKALAGDTVSLLFALKCLFGWREGDQSDSANRVSVTFNIPAALPLDKFMSVENDNRTERLPDPATKRS